ncbi:hypothetical protein AB1K70_19145 [Bremerella sp. JC770]|uniref:hypothetical protein n=1 Tax=Bremerella sp. JC770 TaxID=3232137 RepID=UPI003458C0D7
MSDIDDAVLKLKANQFQKDGPEKKQSLSDKDRIPTPERLLEEARTAGRKDGIEWCSWPGLARHDLTVNCCDQHKEGANEKRHRRMIVASDFWQWLCENYAAFIEHIESRPDRGMPFITEDQWREWKHAFDAVCKEIYVASGGYIPKDPPPIYSEPIFPELD